jgi:hypothetical protein
MAIKMSLEDLESSLRSVLDALRNATKHAQWDGIGGAKSYLDSGRIEVLEKRHGPKVKTGALKLIFKNIVDATHEAFDPLVLKKFAERHFDIIKAYAKEHPTFFLENKNIADICRRSLSQKEKRSLDRMVKLATLSSHTKSFPEESRSASNA